MKDLLKGIGQVLEGLKLIGQMLPTLKALAQSLEEVKALLAANRDQIKIVAANVEIVTGVVRGDATALAGLKTQLDTLTNTLRALPFWPR